MTNGSGNRNVSVPTSTAAQVRVRIYQPTVTPVYRKGEWFETNYGRCQIEGRLGQRHADLMDAIMFCSEKWRDTDDGGIELIVDPARIRKKMADARYGYEQIKILEKDLMQALITIVTPKLPFPIMGKMIDHVMPAAKTRPNPLTRAVGEKKAQELKLTESRFLRQVRLGVVWVKLLEHDLRLFYDPGPVARLRFGISQAVARHLHSHSRPPPGGWYIDTLIMAVAGRISGPELRKYRFRLRQDREQLLAIGFEIDGNRIKSHK